MNRRLFIGQATTGLLLPFLSFSIAVREDYQKKGIVSVPVLQQIAQAIHQGTIGTIEQLTIVHIYSPAILPADALERIAHEDITSFIKLTGLPIPIKEQVLVKNSATPSFGTYVFDLSTATIQATWQGLARHGSQAQPVSCSLRVFGSMGVLQTTNNGTGYQIQNLAGRIIQSKDNPPADVV